MRLIILCLLLCLFGGCSANEAIKEVGEQPNETVSSASIKYRYLDNYIKNSDLIKAFNEDGGISCIGTTNSDNSVNEACFTFEMFDLKYMSSMISESQTLNNLKLNPKAMLIYIEYLDKAKKDLSYGGAKIIVNYISDIKEKEKVAASYKIELDNKISLFEIIEIRPLG